MVKRFLSHIDVFIYVNIRERLPAPLRKKTSGSQKRARKRNRLKLQSTPLKNLFKKRSAIN